MRINQKIFTIALTAFLIVPQLTFAAWWNPLTWKVFSRTKAPEVQVQKIAPSPVAAVPQKSTAPVNDQSKSIIKATAPAKLSNAQIIAKIKPATVYISTDSAAGSGMIFTIDGYVLTNAHVVQGAISAKVSLSTGEIVDGWIVGRDEVVDLAVIKLTTTKPSPKVDFGDSDKTEQGDEVFAFGFPFGIEGDVSFKEGTISRRIEKYFETSAEIHPGNSGGPLVNRYGQVIGVNTAIFGKSVSGVQLGETIKLAIPINNAKNLIAELKAGRSVVLPAEPVQPQRKTYQILSQRDTSNLSPILQALDIASYSEFLQTPDLRYLTPQQQNELFNKIALRRLSEYEAQLHQKLEQVDRINQIISPQPVQPPSPPSPPPFEFNPSVRLSIENDEMSRPFISLYILISEPFDKCVLGIIDLNYTGAYSNNKYFINPGYSWNPNYWGHSGEEKKYTGVVPGHTYEWEFNCEKQGFKPGTRKGTFTAPNLTS